MVGNKIYKGPIKRAIRGWCGASSVDHIKINQPKGMVFISDILNVPSYLFQKGLSSLLKISKAEMTTDIIKGITLPRDGCFFRNEAQ